VTPVWDDPRVSAGMAAQLEVRQRRIDAGERPIGWKVGFGAPAAQQNLGIDAPLTGFLTEGTRLNPAASVSLDGWAKPALEPEIAVHMGRDLGGGADRPTTAAAIVGLGAAIELADLDRPLDDLGGVVASNIFHRHVMLGPVDHNRAGGDAEGLVATVYEDGRQIAHTDDPLVMVGADLVATTAHVAGMLEASGERLRAGDVIITGSVVPLIWPEPGWRVTYELRSLGSLDVSFDESPTR
jgi:2-keto-4-pentenoate hydratase